MRTCAECSHMHGKNQQFSCDMGHQHYTAKHKLGIRKTYDLKARKKRKDLYYDIDIPFRDWLKACDCIDFEEA